MFRAAKQLAHNSFYLSVNENKSWLQQRDFVEITILPALKKRINKSLEYLNEEVVRVLKTNYKSHASTIKIKSDADKWKKKKQRINELQHLIRIKDSSIEKYWPSSVRKNEWKDELAEVVVKTAYYSDEISETDIELAKYERSIKKRYNDNNIDNNHVVKMDLSKPLLDAPFWTIFSSYDPNKRNKSKNKEPRPNNNIFVNNSESYYDF
ncbi:4539_t:CDS:2, partial [Scutellospora calospora]